MVVLSSRFRTLPGWTPATGLKIARQAADVEQWGRHGEAMALLDDLEAGREMVDGLMSKREGSPSLETTPWRIERGRQLCAVSTRDLDASLLA